jgi:hypothetical protein
MRLCVKNKDFNRTVSIQGMSFKQPEEIIVRVGNH